MILEISAEKVHVIDVDDQGRVAVVLLGPGPVSILRLDRPLVRRIADLAASTEREGRGRGLEAIIPRGRA